MQLQTRHLQTRLLQDILADLSEYIYAGANLGDVSAVGAGQWTGYAKQLGFTTTTNLQQIDIS